MKLIKYLRAVIVNHIGDPRSQSPANQALPCLIQRMFPLAKNKIQEAGWF